MNYDDLKTLTLPLIEEQGLINLTRDSVSEAAGFPSMSFLNVTGMNFSDFVEKLGEEGHIGPAVPTTRHRTDPKLRRMQLLRTAVAVSERDGYLNITRQLVAEEAGVSMGLVSSYFGSMPNLRSLVMDYAIRNEIIVVIAQGLGNKNEAARNAPAALKARAIDYLTQN